MTDMPHTHAVANARHAATQRHGTRRPDARVRRHREASLQLNGRQPSGRGARFEHLKRVYD